jgi:hypothetical protein
MLEHALSESFLRVGKYLVFFVERINVLLIAVREYGILQEVAGDARVHLLGVILVTEDIKGKFLQTTEEQHPPGKVVLEDEKGDGRDGVEIRDRVCRSTI